MGKPATANDDLPSEFQQVITIDEAVDKIGLGKFQHKVLFATGTCFMADSVQVMLLSILTRKLQREWEFEESLTSYIASCLFAGATVGTLILGPLGDRWGRKPVLCLAAVIISIFGFVTALCNHYLALFPTFFCVGFGVGGLTVPFDILAEFLDTESRGTYLLLIKYFWTIGSMIVPVLGYLTIELAGSWRLFAALCTLPCLLSLITGILFVPESPRWLVSKGKNEKALVILRDAAKDNGVDADIAFPLNTVIADEKMEEATFADLLSPRWRKLMLTLAVIWATYCFAFYGSILTITRVFDTGEDGADEDFDYSAIFLSSAAELIGTTLAIRLIDTIGRIKTLVGSCIIGGIGIFALCLTDEKVARWVQICCALVARAAQMSMACVAWISTAELLSTEILSTGHSAVNACARFGAVFCPFLVDGNNSLAFVGTVLLIVHLITAISGSTLLETKGIAMGKAILLEEARSQDNAEDYHKMEGTGAFA
eukprot:CAMPEP_0194073076 /NCGR_PEP_ID=MMETSP0149-20130528/626_1 /TAXON_ID=122233 /ORGANISM="Chaetoceros debilis, Strain MM31A-1" /LENGTH=484 /DNA_ID=CAMNT_0038753033 /DNA_START=138 /DNA_END=1592 /DNA_ORIENTATION=+